MMRATTAASPEDTQDNPKESLGGSQGIRSVPRPRAPRTQATCAEATCSEGKIAKAECVNGP